MTEHKPFFFFSYARLDDSPYLKTFFEELRDEVAALEGTQDKDNESVAFRDTHSIDTGEDWDKKISGAVQASKVLICIYTVRYFERDYCGKEFAAFLKRNSTLRYERTQGLDGKVKYHVRDVNNIIPVLWHGTKDLSKKELPPTLVHKLLDTLRESDLVKARVKKDYEDNGLKRLYVRPQSGTRHDFILHLARSIVSAKPLPIPERPLTFEELWHAFRDIPKEYIPEDENLDADLFETRRDAFEPTSLRQGDLLAIEITTSQGARGGWAPYSGEPPLTQLVREIAHEQQTRFVHLTLNPNSDDFETVATSTVEQATRKMAMPILFVDPECFRIDRHKIALSSLFRHKWRGGLIVADQKSNGDGFRLLKDSLRDPSQPDAERAQIILRTSSDVEDLRTSVDSVLLELLGKISEVGQVKQRPSEEEGSPDRKPRITNVLPLSSPEASIPS